MLKELPLHLAQLEPELLPIHVYHLGLEVDGNLITIFSDVVKCLVSQGDAQETQTGHVTLEDERV